MATTTTFDYKVRDREGRLIKGQLEGDSPQLVAQRLRDMGYLPVGISRRSALRLHSEIHIPGLTDRVKLKQVAMMTRQLTTMVASGLTLVRALSVLGDQVESKPLAAAISAIRTDVERGSSLSSALVRHPRIFNHLYIAMVRAGELGGQLDDVLAKVASSLERQVSLRAKVRSALTYPTMMVLVVVAVVATMMIVVVPTFKKLYSQYHGALPLPTKVVIDVSNIVASPWILAVIGVIAAVVAGARRWVATDRGRRAWDALKIRPPVFGPLAHKVALERLASTLAALLSAGVGIIDALEMAAENVGNRVIADAARFAQTSVREGRSLGSAFAECKVIPTMFTQMVETGEESGTVGDMLGKVATFYGDEIESTVGSLTSLIEPLVIVFMGAVIGGIVISLYLPMFKYISLVSHQ